jgi:hypothetical protein
MEIALKYRPFRLKCTRCALAWLAGMLLSPSGLPAQNQLPEEARGELKKFPAHTQAVIPQLFALDWLPQPQWKTHIANLPHGETVDLDDSAWEAVKTGSQCSPV